MKINIFPFVLLINMINTIVYLPRNRIRSFINKIDNKCIYSNINIKNFDSEHVVPNSFIKNNNINRDLYNIFKCDRTINRSRGNRIFNDESKFLINNENVYLNTSKSIIAKTCMYYIYTYIPYIEDRQTFYSRVIDKDTLERWYSEHEIVDGYINDWIERRNFEIYKIQGNKQLFF